MSPDKEYLAPHLRKDVPTCNAVVIALTAVLSAICGKLKFDLIIFVTSRVLFYYIWFIKLVSSIGFTVLFTKFPMEKLILINLYLL